MPEAYRTAFSAHVERSDNPCLDASDAGNPLTVRFGRPDFRLPEGDPAERGQDGDRRVESEDPELIPRRVGHAVG